MLSILQQHQFEFSSALISQQDGGNDFVSKINTSSKIDPQHALDIYRNNTRGARINTLELVFPVCMKIVGYEVFHSIARAYAISDMYGQSDLNYYGEYLYRHFQLLLNTDRLAEEYSYLTDLAKLEFSIHCAYYADNDPDFNFQLFEQKINNEEPFYLQTSVSLGLLKSTYPIYQIWFNNRNHLATKNVYALDETQYLLVHRDGYKPVVNPLDKSEYVFLEACVNDVLFQEIVENSEYDIDVILPKMITNKWIVGIK